MLQLSGFFTEKFMSKNRMHFNNTIHFVTNRTEHEMFLLLPHENITKLIQGWFARAHRKCGQGLEIYAFIFMSNHFHILCNDTRGTLAAFMCYFQSNLAKAINQELNRSGRFWSREYDDVIVEGDDAVIDRFAYTVCNAVKSGLVNTAAEWIGWSSLTGAMSDGKYSFELLNKTKLHHATRNGKKVDKSKFIETWSFELTPPPFLQQKSEDERTGAVKALIETAESQYRAARGEKPPLGAAGIMKQHCFDRPQAASFRPRIAVLCFDKARKDEWRESYRAFVGGYREVYDGYKKASYKRRKVLSLKWPEGSYPPSCMVPVGMAEAV